jgi:hypothetical protein
MTMGSGNFYKFTIDFAIDTDTVSKWAKLTIYAPMIYTAPCVMVLMRTDTYVGKWGGGGGFGEEKNIFVGPI